MLNTDNDRPENVWLRSVTSARDTEQAFYLNSSGRKEIRTGGMTTSKFLTPNLPKIAGDKVCQFLLFQLALCCYDIFTAPCSRA